jgi:hypothetical protein
MTLLNRRTLGRLAIVASGLLVNLVVARWIVHSSGADSLPSHHLSEPTARSYP